MVGSVTMMFIPEATGWAELSVIVPTDVNGTVTTEPDSIACSPGADSALELRAWLPIGGRAGSAPWCRRLR